MSSCARAGKGCRGGGAWAIRRGGAGTSGVRVGGPGGGARDNLDTSARDLWAGTLEEGAVVTVIMVLARLVTLVTWAMVETVTREGDPGLVTASVSRDPMI